MRAEKEPLDTCGRHHGPVGYRRGVSGGEEVRKAEVPPLVQEQVVTAARNRRGRQVGGRIDLDVSVSTLHTAAALQ